MLIELRVANLGVIEDLSVVLDPGMTALTGETGAGKTLIVEAISLLAGGPAYPQLVLEGAEEALVEARFYDQAQDREVLLARVVPASGRSRSYLDGRMVPLATLKERGSQLVELHGQHEAQTLLAPSAQRSLLDRFGGLDPNPLVEARRRVGELRRALQGLGGDAAARQRELDLLSFAVAEIARAQLVDPNEEQRLEAEAERLSELAALRQAAAGGWAALCDDDGVTDALGRLAGELRRFKSAAALSDRAVALQSEAAELARDLRELAESAEDDPARLARIDRRRALLGELKRKYGSTLAEVASYGEWAKARIEQLRSHEGDAARLREELEVEQERAHKLALELWQARREAAARFGSLVAERLAALALPGSRFEVEVGTPPGSEEVQWRFAADPGQPLAPLGKVASGGELSRVMLAARLVAGPAGQWAGEGVSPTLVFDEVDAGVGGEAALAVAEALAELARSYQVLVVTHLPQVAALAGSQLVVSKRARRGRVSVSLHKAQGQSRVVEISRMLSGRPDSPTARRHAEELLGARSSGPSSGRASMRWPSGETTGEPLSADDSEV